MCISRIFLFAALVVFPLLATLGCQDEDREARLHTSVRTDEVKPPVEKPPRELLTSQAAFIEVSSKVTPAVVNIRTSRPSAVGDFGPLFEDFFGDFFGNRLPRGRQQQSLGSGFIISEDGYILTNEHVVDGAGEVTVKLSDQRVFQGRIVGVDTATDVAVLKIDSDESLPSAVLGDSDLLQVGQWALAIGNPFGLDRTLTVGVISGIGRADIGIEDFEDFIQTDASINPGNSGGPLLNIYGEVVGINTAIVASGQGIGFAIPVNLARLIADQLIEKGEVSRGWLGVSIQPLTPDLAQSFGLEKVTGALVNQVLPDTPADRAGIRRGDILLTLEGKEIRGVRTLQTLVASMPAGSTAEIEVLREGRRITLPVTIVARKLDETAMTEPAGDRAEAFGLTVVPAEEKDGLRVEEVAPNSTAAAAGVRAGDRILSLNRIEVRDLASFDRAVRKASKDKNVILLLQRGQTTLYLAFPAS